MAWRGVLVVVFLVAPNIATQIPYQHGKIKPEDAATTTTKTSTTTTPTTSTTTTTIQLAMFSNSTNSRTNDSTTSSRVVSFDASVPWYLIFSRASNHTHRGHHLSTEFTYIVSSIFILIIVVGVSCNLLLIFTIVSVTKLHSHMHCFIVNMAVGDILVALGAIPFDVDYMLSPR